jgi:alpha-tubulin suppressor-like RCC1 family protein
VWPQVVKASVYSRALHSLRVDQVACGGAHTLMRFDDGTVASCGCDRSPTPTPLSHSQVLQSIAHSYGLCALTWFVLTGTASLVKAQCMSVPSLSQWRAWPLARYGRLRVPSTFIVHARDAASTLQPSSSQVACGGMHTLLLDDAGKLLAFGRCVNQPSQLHPPPLHSHHSLHNKTLDQFVPTRCSGANGRLGLGNTTTIAKPAEVNALASVSVTCDV